jgi:hypothetical protein
MTTEVEALILLDEGGAVRSEEVEAAATAVGGRVVAGFLPHALIVQVTEEVVEDLRHTLGAATVYTEAVPATAVEAAAEPLRSVLAAWNQRRSLPGARPEPPSRGLAWDAPGFLPPDPPPEIRERLRRREQQLGEVDDSSSA